MSPAHDRPSGAADDDPAPQRDPVRAARGHRSAERAGPEIVAERLKERIYAALTVAAVMMGLALADAVGPGAAALSVVATAVGLWLATIAADQQAHAVVYGRFARGRELTDMVFVTSPLLAAAAGPLVLIGVSALGVLDLTTALYVSVAVELATLFAWGVLSGRRMGSGPLAALLAGAVNFVIGVVVIGVKLLAGH